MHHYKYDGPVIAINGRSTAHKWTAETHADTEAKAKNNIRYQYKRDHGLIQKTKIYLPNDMVEII